MGEKILVCIAWPYAKSVTHVGQIVGSILPGDIFARYNRMIGNDVLMVSGSDAHGTPITVEADQEGVEPDVIVERYHPKILEVWEKLDIQWDLYTKTTTPNHYAVTQDVFLKLLNNGYLFKDGAIAPFCPTDNRFLQDRYILGECPNCHYGKARGDQCEECGHLLEPQQLMNPYCRICGSKTSSIEFRETEHFYFNLPLLQDKLQTWLNAVSAQWRPNVVNFAMNWLKEGLKPRAITRDLNWGVPIPVAGFENKRIYVWFDAVIGYLSASKEWAQLQGRPEAWREWWEVTPENPRPSRSYYFIGKDNISFHAIFWPAMLIGYENLVLAYDVPANEFMQMGGHKASSSDGNVVWTPDALARYGGDALRYYLTISMPETHDSNFSYEELVRFNNDELVGVFGNAAHRVLTFTHKNYGATVPTPGEFTAEDKALLEISHNVFELSGKAIAAVKLREGLAESMNAARAINKYIDEQAPWKVMKTDKQRAGTVLYTVIQALGALRITLTPYIPAAAQRLHELLGFSGLVKDTPWQFAEVLAGQALPEPKPLFTKFDPPAAAEPETAKTEAAK